MPIDSVDITISADDADQRVDRFLRKLLVRAPLSLIHKMLRRGRVRIGDVAAQPADRLREGDVLRLRARPDQFAEWVDRERPAPRARGGVSVVFRDDDLLVVDKPGGLAVHDGSGIADDHLVARVRGLVPARAATTFRPAPAHRIDRGTSGIVVFGLSAVGLRGMAELFRGRRVRKTYLAVARGSLDPPEGVIELPLEVADRGPGRRRARVVGDGGKLARTGYRTMRATGDKTQLAVSIDTGRMHQIRAHLAELGAPIVGDRRYGDRVPSPLAAKRLALHAWRLQFTHPCTAVELELEAPWPDDLEALL